MIYLVVLADAAESVRDAIGFEYCLSSSDGWTKSPVLWAEIGEGNLIRPELVLEMTDKVVLIKENLKATRVHQKSYTDKRRKPLEFEVGNRVLLRVSPWKGVVHFGNMGKLAPKYVGAFEILKRIGLVAYRLRLPEEFNSVHDTFHVSNLKKCLADANFHVPLDEINVDKTLRFVKEPVDIMDGEIKKLKRRKIVLVKVGWNSKCGLDDKYFICSRIVNMGNERRIACNATTTLTFPGIEEHAPYTIVDEPQIGLIYLNSKDEKRVMYLEEIAKFCDASLEKFLNEVKLIMFKSKFLKKPPLLGKLDQDIMKAYER
ncbi:hypothetical protein Tco_0979243 [Tanacetum coccineum]